MILEARGPVPGSTSVTTRQVTLGKSCNLPKLHSWGAIFAYCLLLWQSAKLMYVFVQSLSCVQLFAIPWTAACQASCPSLSPRVCSDSCPLSQWCHPTISASVTHPLSPPSLNLSQHQGIFQWVGFLHQVAKVLELQLQHQSFQWIVRVDFL